MHIKKAQVNEFAIVFTTFKFFLTLYFYSILFNDSIISIFFSAKYVAISTITENTTVIINAYTKLMLFILLLNIIRSSSHVFIINIVKKYPANNPSIIPIAVKILVSFDI